MAQEFEEVQRQLIEVQSQLAFQEDTVRALNEAMAAQQQEILVLRRQLAMIKQRQDEQAARGDEDVGSMPVDEKPPHY